MFNTYTSYSTTPFEEYQSKMLMLIKCLHRLPALVAILVIGRIVGVECIKNDGVEHQQVVGAHVDGVFDDAVSTISQFGRDEG